MMRRVCWWRGCMAGNGARSSLNACDGSARLRITPRMIRRAERVSVHSCRNYSDWVGSMDPPSR